MLRRVSYRATPTVCGTVVLYFLTEISQKMPDESRKLLRGSSASIPGTSEHNFAYDLSYSLCELSATLVFVSSKRGRFQVIVLRLPTQG